MSDKVEEFVTHFVVMCDDQAYFAAANSETYTEANDPSVAFSLVVGGGNSITCT